MPRLVERAGDGRERGGRDGDGRLLRTLFDRLPALIAYWDRDARNVVANAAYVEWFGLSPEAVRGLHISEVLGAEVYAKNLPFISAALAGEEQLFDRTLVDQAGRTRHTQASYVPDVVDGEVCGFFVLVTDVTPRVEAQRAMDEAQSLAHLGSWSLQAATGEVRWSRELFSITGVEPAETMQLAELSRAIHPEDVDRVLANLEAARASGESYVIDYRIVRPDGTVREVQSRGRPERGPDGSITTLTGTIQDLTESNAAARELVRVNAELRRSGELTGDVIAMLGHDLRAPITSTAGFLELLDQHWESVEDADRRDLLARALAGTRRLARTAEQILALARIDSGTLLATPRTLELGRLLAEAVEDAGLTGRARIAVPPDARAIFDRVHLGQVLVNLLTNAARYGGDPIGLTATPAAAGGWDLAVTDGGAGVPEAHQGRLFERFARTGELQDAAGGTGFGLYMAARLCEASGGSLRYEPASAQAPHRFVVTTPA